MAKHLADTEDAPQPPLWRTKVALSAVLMLIVVVVTIYGFRWLITEQPSTPEPTVAVDHEDTTPDLTDEPASLASPAPGETVIIHVAGEVQEPGIVELDVDGRVVDAIEAAGGPTAQASLDALNLAAVVHDGEYILVPDAETATSAAGPQLPDTGAASGGGNSAPVNLNTADPTELETLPGVGPATAAQIIAHREQHGPFTQLADLESVSGIGPATRERLDGLVTW